MKSGKKTSKLKKIENQISQEFNIDKKLVNKIIVEALKEIGWIIVFKKSPVMIKGFLKIVSAVRFAKNANKVVKRISKSKTGKK